LLLPSKCRLVRPAPPHLPRYATASVPAWCLIQKRLQNDLIFVLNGTCNLTWVNQLYQSCHVESVLWC